MLPHCQHQILRSIYLDPNLSTNLPIFQSPRHTYYRNVQTLHWIEERSAVAMKPPQLRHKCDPERGFLVFWCPLFHAFMLLFVQLPATLTRNATEDELRQRECRSLKWKSECTQGVTSSYYIPR
ncbi:hypothetical protein KC19_VG100700 [Ceratodon purpureus]|uniref:Uncharacterized protein n=1 Tax=Ceratodon purpureus TaxID=3225 RepID=A0A8T0HNY1_CERPU|nr:hypothetical protein KC19_VG100700 [Ceratodon purpureus]